jgi:hypothetical protein
LLSDILKSLNYIKQSNSNQDKRDSKLNNLFS